MIAQSATFYSSKLRDPRWQRKRLEILQRDNWTCQVCLATDRELHVHHKSYLNGREPWDYSGSFLVTLCKECHEKEPAAVKRTLDHLFWRLRAFYTSPEIKEFDGAFSLLLGHYCVVRDGARELTGVSDAVLKQARSLAWSGMQSALQRIRSSEEWLATNGRNDGQ